MAVQIGKTLHQKLDHTLFHSFLSLNFDQLCEEKRHSTVRTLTEGVEE